jgi:hypothetical protein
VRRRLVIALAVIGLLLFLAVSAVLARVLSLDGAERSAITALVQAEARGDVRGAEGQILGCQPSARCRVRVARVVRALARPGPVAIIQIQPSAGFSLSSTRGTARVAWRAGFSLPIVQCVRVARAGDALSGFQVQLLELSPRIKSDAACPARF